MGQHSPAVLRQLADILLDPAASSRKAAEKMVASGKPGTAHFTNCVIAGIIYRGQLEAVCTKSELEAIANNYARRRAGAKSSAKVKVKEPTKRPWRPLYAQPKKAPTKPLPAPAPSVRSALLKVARKGSCNFPVQEEGAGLVYCGKQTLKEEFHPLPPDFANMRNITGYCRQHAHLSLTEEGKKRLLLALSKLAEATSPSERASS